MMIPINRGVVALELSFFHVELLTCGIVSLNLFVLSVYLHLNELLGLSISARYIKCNGN